MSLNNVANFFVSISRELFVQSLVSIGRAEPVQGRSNRHVFVDCHFLAVRNEDRGIVIVVGYRHFYVGGVDMRGVGVLDVDRHVEEWVEQGVEVDRLTKHIKWNGKFQSIMFHISYSKSFLTFTDFTQKGIKGIRRFEDMTA